MPFLCVRCYKLSDGQLIRCFSDIIVLIYSTSTLGLEEATTVETTE